MKDSSDRHDGFARATRLGFREGLLIRLEVIGYGLAAAIASSLLYRFLGWMGASEKVSFALAFVFAVTAFWLLGIFGVWANIEGDSRRSRARQKDKEGSGS